MKKYQNLAGNSGVLAYEIGPEHIKVRFHENPSVYSYSYENAGRQHVEQMKVLAERGKGLSTYISKYVRDLYD